MYLPSKIFKREDKVIILQIFVLDHVNTDASCYNAFKIYDSI